MPASRSRTENWRKTLQKVCDRNGAVEINFQRVEQHEHSESALSGKGVDLIWRVRLMRVTDDEILIEEPSTLGQRIEIHDHVNMVVVFSLGQNRWMFRTHSMGRTKVPLNADKDVIAIRLKLPDTVERCQRRQFYRVSTVGLALPKVEAHPLLDPLSAIPAETAVRTRIEMMNDGQIAGYVGDSEPLVLPEVGPPTTTTLVNLGGGGAGLVVDAEDAASFDQHRLFWLTLHLQPQIPAPLGVVARLAHVRMDSEQRRYLGMSFEFSHHQNYKHFVINTLCKCVTDVQRAQLRRRADHA